MKIIDLDSFITLVLIKEVEEFRDSYSLTKVLAWKFNVISVSEITERLKMEQLIKSTLENGISKYELTEAGLKYIEINMEEGRNLLLQKYNSEQNFIGSLLP